MTDARSDIVLDALRDALDALGTLHLSTSVFSLLRTPETIVDRIVRVVPSDFQLRQQGRCLSYVRSWAVEILFAERGGDASRTLRDFLLIEEDQIVDALLDCPYVTAISGTYAEVPDMPYLALLLTVTTDSTRTLSPGGAGG